MRGEKVIKNTYFATVLVFDTIKPSSKVSQTRTLVMSVKAERDRERERERTL